MFRTRTSTARAALRPWGVSPIGYDVHSCGGSDSCHHSQQRSEPLAEPSRNTRNILFRVLLSSPTLACRPGDKRMARAGDATLVIGVGDPSHCDGEGVGDLLAPRFSGGAQPLGSRRPFLLRRAGRRPAGIARDWPALNSFAGVADCDCAACAGVHFLPVFPVLLRRCETALVLVAHMSQFAY